MLLATKNSDTSQFVSFLIFDFYFDCFVVVHCFYYCYLHFEQDCCLIESIFFYGFSPSERSYIFWSTVNRFPASLGDLGFYIHCGQFLLCMWSQSNSAMIFWKIDSDIKSFFMKVFNWVPPFWSRQFYTDIVMLARGVFIFL